MTVILHQQKSDILEVNINIQISEKGDFILSGVESGELVKKIEGDYDYEYTLTVHKKHVKALKKCLSSGNKIKTDEEVLAEVAKRFGERDAYVKLKHFLKENRILFKDFTWV